MASNDPEATAKGRAEVDVAVRQAYLVFARRLRQLNRLTLGLWPFPEESDLQSAPRCLGRALASFGIHVALVERQACWHDGRTQQQLSITSESDGLDLLVPVRAQSAHNGVVLEEILAFARSRYGCILLDLSGMDLHEASEVATLPDVGIVLFVARGQCSEFALAKVQRRFPAGHVVGGVLISTESSSS